jgi:hypothetical protein
MFISRNHATHIDNLSSGKDAGFSTGTPVDLHRMRTVFPDRWAAFLKAHFRDSVSVAFFFSVNEKTARLWMEGTTAPRAEVVLSLIERAPSVLPFLLSEAA